MKRIIDYFRLQHEKEDLKEVIKNIEAGIVFRGTNLWVLTFAIFVASLGLNVNSTAVIIGAMLISPLMGPIIGLGVGMGIHDIQLLKKSALNFFFAVVVSLITSTIYFLLSPIDKAHSEILARTSPNIYDVLIAFFGGMAGIIAITSRQKGNVITGVAIATALMPPLCTAGYGIATGQLNFFFGALYLFIINTVFIALSTLIGVRLFRFPQKLHSDDKRKSRANLIVGFIVIITILPSLYFGYDIVQQNNFSDRVNRFIDKEAALTGDYLLKKEVDRKNKTITLTYGGRLITEGEIDSLRSKLKHYDLEKSELEVRQGFSILENKNNDGEISQVSAALESMELELRSMRNKFDSVAIRDSLFRDSLFKKPVSAPIKKRKK